MVVDGVIGYAQAPSLIRVSTWAIASDPSTMAGIPGNGGTASNLPIACPWWPADVRTDECRADRYWRDLRPPGLGPGDLLTWPSSTLAAGNTGCAE